jgi:peptide/nickel transport system substrate-binding protein
VAVALVAGLTACGAGDGGPDDAAGDALTIGLVAEPETLDFTVNDAAAGPQVLLDNVYEGLVKIDQSGDIVPDLATSWEVSDDEKTYTFHLVDDAEFTSGAKFTADDAVFSINRAKNGWGTTLGAAMAVVSDVQATSDTELVVTLSHPSNDWLFRMTTRLGAMFSRTGVDDLATTPIGTGPYKFVKWNRGDSIVLERNDDYWGTKPHFKTITLRYFSDPTALNNALLTGTIDVVGTVQAPESLAHVEDDSGYHIIEGTTNGEVVLSFNHRNAPFQDLRVRQAIRYAIDHRALVDTCWAGHGTLIGSMVPPTDPWYEDRTGDYPFDPDRAKSLLAEAAPDGLTLRLRLPNLPYAQDCGRVVQSMLEDVGITIDTDTLEFPAQWLQQVFTDHDYDMSIIAHVEPRDIPAVFGNPTYYLGYDNPDVRSLLAAADEGSTDEQVADMKQVGRILSEDAAADWLFLLPNLIVADTGITGLPRNAVGEAFDLSALGRD